ncbi:MAG TPA: polymer-forming cytoskeletal protein [Burkholderiales bacterium]|jgi:Integral membrane protein CcmA involved in cell shape determination
MFNRDGIFSNKKDEPARKDVKPVNLTPGLASSMPQSRPAAEPAKTDTAAPASQAAKSAAEEPRGSKLIVGPDIKLKGVEITDCDTLVVEGRVEASMDSRVVQIAETGVFLGTVGIDVAEIRGRFEGELTARKHLIIHATGRVSGKIRYGKITIEEGGELSGDVSTTRSAQSETRAEGAASGESVDVMTAYDPFARKNKPLAKSAPGAI